MAQYNLWQLLLFTAVVSSFAAARGIDLHGQTQLVAELPPIRPHHGRRKLQQVQDLCNEPFPSIPFNWRSKRKVLALTFDDGPDAYGLVPLLDMLKKHKIQAAFFFNSYNLRSGGAEIHKAAAARAFKEGHEIGSHAAEHVDLTKLDKRQINQQLLWNIGNISAITGSADVPLFRAPYGAGYWTNEKQADEVTKYLWKEVQKHHVHVMWSWDGKDWALRGDESKCAGLYHIYGPDLVQQNVTGVVLMHAYNGAMGMCVDILDKLIQYWRDHGYAFVKVSQLVQERYGLLPADVVRAAQCCTI